MLGEDHPDTLESAHNLAIDLRTLGDHAAAAQVEEQIRSQRAAGSTPTTDSSDKILMPLARRSRVVETWGASRADVVVTWCGLSPWTRLTLESAPVGYSGLPPFRARISDS